MESCVAEFSFLTYTFTKSLTIPNKQNHLQILNEQTHYLVLRNHINLTGRNPLFYK
jgi:hypothetical protein